MTWRKLAAAAPVAVVAIIAAIISYGHIESLALSVHQPLAAARLLPFAVDFLIIAGSVILLAGYALGWLCVISGVAATLFANVESGVPYGPMGAAVSAWPAVAFTVASFVLERWLRRQASVPAISVQVGQLSQPVPAVPVPEPVPVPVPAQNGGSKDLPEFADLVAAGTVPTIRDIRARVHCGQPKAQEIRAQVQQVLAARAA